MARHGHMARPVGVKANVPGGHVKNGASRTAGAKILVLEYRFLFQSGQVAQSVEQRTENPCVGGSIPPLATINSKG